MKTLALTAMAVVLVVAGPARAALVVSSGATSNVSCASGVCTATATDAVLNEKDFRRLISHGDLTLASGSAAQDIVIAAKVQWAKNNHLTLDAYRSIIFQFELTSEGTGGATLTTNDGGSGGALAFTGKGKMTFWDTSSALTIDGVSYTLANDIATLAADIAAHPSGAFALGRGYDASVDGAYRSAPIPTPFNGAFEGLGHAIDQLSLFYKKRSASINLGLFLSIGAAGSVRDLALTNARVVYRSNHTSGNITGALAAVSAGLIQNVALANSTVTGQCVGGIAGENDGTMVNVNVSASQVGALDYQSAGGLACFSSGTIARSSVDASVGAGHAGAAGGLVAGNGGTISLSHAAGQVSVAGENTGNYPPEYAGGLAASNGGTISQSYSTAAVYGGSCYAGESHSNSAYGGGVVADNAGTIVDSYVTGATSTGDYRGCNANAGGVVAVTETGSVLQRVYSTGQVACGDCGGGDYWGGLIGYDAHISNQSAYWDLDTSGITDPSRGAGYPANDPGLTGLSDAALKSALPSGFDPAIWGESGGINNGYPYLLANPPQ